MNTRCQFSAVAVLWILVSGTAYGFYNPQQGRWLSRDPSGEGSGINIYQYARSSPQNFIDPDGRSPVLAIMIGAAVWGAVYTPLNANAPSEDSPQYEPTTPEEVAWNAASAAVTAGAFAWAGSAIGAIGSRNACPITVSRWGQSGLRSGSWVVKGPVNKWNYFRTGKWEQWHPWNEFAPYESGMSFNVPPSTVQWPKGVNVFRGLPPFSQRQYVGPTIEQ